ncbi:MAG: enoyl-CoA hydratase/isomerase family protein [Calditerrivibrio sp.]|nr:enoyl-CoA hydratase/isomerase family protein [Calditerrivibrio sp.]MCA1933743.1 enoyl-CoA hydratase/isomerase family protein [Calditerrivibrio sp.]MCA1981170.1 enoyl-CoA hydratase/isomerase family protein [Calditerrivibrio sp.]
MDYKHLKFEKRNDGVMILKISRVEALNALNKSVLNELSYFFNSTMNDCSIRVVVLTGDGEKSFVAGADIKEMYNLNLSESVSFAKYGQKLLLSMYNYHAPIVAAVNGYALGGGFEMALCCDVIFASKNARFGFPEVTLGIIPGFGGTQVLRRLVGEKNAKYLILSGEIISAEDAYRMNILSKIYENQADLVAGAINYAEKIAKNSPKSVELAKRAINVSFDLSLERGLEYESSLFGVLFTTDDQKEGMRAFVEKRKAEFKGN